MNKPNSPPPSCGNCAEWTRHSDERMATHGECAQRQAGHYSHQSRGCLFNPSRWQGRRAPRAKAA